MAVRVAINDPRVVEDLARSLEGNACTVCTLSDRAFEVTSIGGRTAEELRVDLRFFLRAWARANPGVHILVD